MRPYLRAANVTWDGLALDDVKEMNFSPAEVATFRLTPGDILLAEASGSASEVGKPAVWRGEIADCCFQNTLLRVRTRHVRSHYLLWFFKWLALSGQFARGARGVGIHHLGAKALSDWTVPVAPVDEQERIIGRIEELFSRLDAGQAALRSALDRVGRMREAFLDEVVMGRVPPGHDPAAAAVSNKEELPPLPPGWRCLTLDEVRESDRPIVYGIIKPGPHVADGVPYVRVTEMKDGVIDPTTLRRAETGRARLFERASLRSGDILISKDGTIGRVAVVPPGLDGANITQHLVRLSVRREFNRDFIVSALRSPWSQRWLSRETRGVALQGVNVGDFRRLPLPIPPRHTQDRLQQMIEAAMTDISAGEAAVIQGIRRVSSLQLSVLTAAFSGKLVDQDPNDEPASDLLKRILTARAASNGQSQYTRRTRTPVTR
jgi:type I restriction enzyme S subunit